VPDQQYLENRETLNLDLANLKSTAPNADLSQEARERCLLPTESIANRSHDPRREDARLVLTEIEPQPSSLLLTPRPIRSHPASRSAS